MPTPPFEIPQTIAPSDIDALGHVNNTVYLRWIQDVAVAHWQLIAPSEDQIDFAWIVLRHEIDYKQPALLTDDILLRTWVGAAEGLRFERFTEVLRTMDRAILAQARTLWCPVDPRSGRPKRVSSQVRQLFSVPQGSL